LSVTLQWDVPRENKEDEITVYDNRFRPNDGDGYSNETSVSEDHKLTLTSASGIVPQTTYEFRVRARTRDALWEIGKQLLIRQKLSYYTLVCI